MKVLFATTNPAKINKHKLTLEQRGIEVLTVRDVGQELVVEECGKDAIQNANIKAKAYYDAFHIPTIGMDNCLYLENVCDYEQPGTHVRRVNGRELTDDEMIEYYTNLAKRHGGKLSAKWIYGMVIYTKLGKSEFSWSKDGFYLIDQPCERRNVGYPLDSISINANNEYFVNLTSDEKVKSQKDNNDEVIEFMVSTLKQ